MLYFGKMNCSVGGRNFNDYWRGRNRFTFLVMPSGEKLLSCRAPQCKQCPYNDKTEKGQEKDTRKNIASRRNQQSVILSRRKFINSLSHSSYLLVSVSQHFFTQDIECEAFGDFFLEKVFASAHHTILVTLVKCGESIKL